MRQKEEQKNTETENKVRQKEEQKNTDRKQGETERGTEKYRQKTR